LTEGINHQPLSRPDELVKAHGLRQREVPAHLNGDLGIC
jgi:hypothetical protein